MQVSNAEPTVDAAGRAGFVAEVERLVRCLAPSSHRLALYCLEFDVRERPHAPRLARLFAGRCGLLVELASPAQPLPGRRNAEPPPAA